MEYVLSFVMSLARLQLVVLSGVVRLCLLLSPNIN